MRNDLTLALRKCVCIDDAFESIGARCLQDGDFISGGRSIYALDKLVYKILPIKACLENQTEFDTWQAASDNLREYMAECFELTTVGQWSVLVCEQVDTIPNQCADIRQAPDYVCEHPQQWSIYWYVHKRLSDAHWRNFGLRNGKLVMLDYGYGFKTGYRPDRDNERIDL